MRGLEAGGLLLAFEFLHILSEVGEVCLHAGAFVAELGGVGLQLAQSFAVGLEAGGLGLELFFEGGLLWLCGLRRRGHGLGDGLRMDGREVAGIEPAVCLLGGEDGDEAVLDAEARVAVRGLEGASVGGGLDDSFDAGALAELSEVGEDGGGADVHDGGASEESVGVDGGGLEPEVDGARELDAEPVTADADDLELLSLAEVVEGFGVDGGA